MAKCDWCEFELPAGCLRTLGESEECPLEPRTDGSWLVGSALMKDLLDRRGIKHALGNCDLDIQVEITETLGRIAIEAVAKLKDQE